MHHTCCDRYRSPHQLLSCANARNQPPLQGLTRGEASGCSNRPWAGPAQASATPAAADRWTWLVIAAHTQLRLARDPHRRSAPPLGTARPPERLTPARVRRGFRHLRARITRPGPRAETQPTRSWTPTRHPKHPACTASPCRENPQTGHSRVDHQEAHRLNAKLSRRPGRTTRTGQAPPAGGSSTDRRRRSNAGPDVDRPQPRPPSPLCGRAASMSAISTRSPARTTGRWSPCGLSGFDGSVTAARLRVYGRRGNKAGVASSYGHRGFRIRSGCATGYAEDCRSYHDVTDSSCSRPELSVATGSARAPRDRRVPGQVSAEHHGVLSVVRAAGEGAGWGGAQRRYGGPYRDKLCGCGAPTAHQGKGIFYFYCVDADDGPFIRRVQGPAPATPSSRASSREVLLDTKRKPG